MATENNNKHHKPKVKRTIIVLIIVIITLSNTPPAAFFLQPAYHYQTRDAEFSYTEEPGKGLDYQVLQIRYNEYREANKNRPERDIQLYRTFTFKPWQFWQWWEMIVRNGRFRLPYLEI